MSNWITLFFRLFYNQIRSIDYNFHIKYRKILCSLSLSPGCCPKIFGVNPPSISAPHRTVVCCLLIHAATFLVLFYCLHPGHWWSSFKDFMLMNFYYFRLNYYPLKPETAKRYTKDWLSKIYYKIKSISLPLKGVTMPSRVFCQSNPNSPHARTIP